jgi:YesN/AraC family two-component response regulator
MKPVDEDRLIEAVQRVKKKLKGERDAVQNETLLYNINKAGNPLKCDFACPH